MRPGGVARIAISMSAVADAGTINTGCWVAKNVRSPVCSRVNSARNSGLRWLIIGRSIAAATSG